MTRDDIKRAAHLRGVSLKDLAAKMDITEVSLHQSLRAIETGGVTLGTLERIAVALGCSVADFYPHADDAVSCRCPHCGGALRLSVTK